MADRRSQGEAARRLRGGIKTVLIPEENAKDLIEISDSVKGALKIIPVSRMDEVLGHSLVRKPEPIAWGQGSAKPAERTVEAGFSTLTSH